MLRIIRKLVFKKGKKVNSQCCLHKTTVVVLQCSSIFFTTAYFYPINLSTPPKIIHPCSKAFDAFMDSWICREMVFWSRFCCRLLLHAESSLQARKYYLPLIPKPANNLPLMGHCEPNESSFTRTTQWTVSRYFSLVESWTYGHYKRQFMHHNAGCTAVITKVSFWE